jgi:O-antigen/teichoic acid export membrane protein
MGLGKNSIIKNSFWNLFGGAVPVIVGFVSIPFAIKGLGKDGFGILTIGWIVLGYFGLFDLGFSQATTKFSSQYLSKGETEKFNSVFWVSLITSLGMGFIGSIMFFAFTPLLISRVLTIPSALLGDAKNTFMILGGMLPIIIATTSLRGVMAASNRFDLLNKIQMPSNILTYIIPCLSYFFGINLTMVIILISIMRMSIFLIYIYYTFSLHSYISKRPVFDIKIFRSMLGFGGWISLSNFVSPLLVYLDRFLIGSLISVSSVSFYTAPYELVIRTRLFPNAIMESIFPKFSSFSKDDDISSISELFLKSLKYISIVMSFVVFIFITYSYEILQIWLGKNFADTSNNVMQILTLGLFFNAIATVPFFLLQGIGKPDIPAKIHLVELLIFSVMFYYMIKYFGITGAAITWTCRTFFDFLFLFIATHHIHKKIFDVEDFKLILKLFVIIFLISGFSFYLQLINHSILLKILIFVGLGGLMFLLIWSITLKKIERLNLLNKVKSIYFQFAR